ncbi:MAG: ABC transporter substrate-binding protein, partial [Rhizobiales bacterium]|nr:ABC transporter substrate-binding protein [Hyphomicrobiales bacterium]
MGLRGCVVRLALIAGAILSLGFSAPAQTPVRLALDWRYEGPAALFLYGLDKGFFSDEGIDLTIEPGSGSREPVQRVATGGFSDEGIDLTIEPGSGSREPVQRVATGGFDLGFGDVNTLIRFRDQNPAADLKAVMMVYDKPPFAIIGRKSRGVGADLRSLAGKRFGAPAGDGAYAQWPVFKAINKLDDSTMKFDNVGFPVREPMLASGELDAVFGFAHSTAVSLKARGVPADDIVTLLMADYGLDLYGNAIIASPKFLAEKPETMKAFLRALVRSVRAAAADPDEAVASVLKRNEGARRDVEAERLRMAIE